MGEAKAPSIIDCDMRGCRETARPAIDRVQPNQQHQRKHRYAKRADHEAGGSRVELTQAAYASLGQAERRQSGVGGRCPGHPRLAWCGCWLMQHLGLNDRNLWIAREWARKFRRTAAGIGAIVVWSHHVGIITGQGDQPGVWRVLSGNDGGAVRERLRSVHGAIAFVSPG